MNVAGNWIIQTLRVVLAVLLVMCAIAAAGVVLGIGVLALMRGRIPSGVAVPATLHGVGLVLFFGPWQSKLLLGSVLLERLCNAAIVFGTVSRMLRDAARGAAFSERNVFRLRLIAAAYGVSLLCRFTLPFLARPVLRHWLASIQWSFNGGDLVLMLVCLALAEVFREGLRLREDAALTV